MAKLGLSEQKQFENHIGYHQLNGDALDLPPYNYNEIVSMAEREKST